MVWKFSYMQVKREEIPKARTYSSFFKPCTDLSDGWCNIPDKTLGGAKEQMIVAYHERQPVYAYSSALNPNLGKNEAGANLMKNSWMKLIDKCISFKNIRPAVSHHNHAKKIIYGIAFDKLSPDRPKFNCDTVEGNYQDCRWHNCKLPKSVSPDAKVETQMTLAIYVR